MHTLNLVKVENELKFVRTSYDDDWNDQKNGILMEQITFNPNYDLVLKLDCKINVIINILE